MDEYELTGIILDRTHKNWDDIVKYKTNNLPEICIGDLILSILIFKERLKIADNLGLSRNTCIRLFNKIFKLNRYNTWVDTLLLNYTDYKLCTKCKVIIQKSNFSKDKIKKSEIRSICKVCDNTIHKNYYLNNIDKCKNASIKHYKNNKSDYIARNAKRRACVLNATPAWADLVKIKLIYSLRPDDYHVDHIVPLKGKLVCGLHVENNLQYLLAKDNKSKYNK